MDKGLQSFLVATFLIFLLILSYTNLGIKPPVESTIPPKIGIYYYVWYTDDWNTYHKDSPDTPYLGRYSSANQSIIVQHLNWFKELGIDFIIFSWWGRHSLSDTNTRLVLNQIAKNYTEIQFFIMVEPFDNFTTENYNLTRVYDYIYDNYVTQFNLNCFYLDGRPVIGFFDKTGKGVPNDNRFTLRLIGCNPGYDWEYQVPNPTLSTQPVCRDKEISICPRYDANNWFEDIDYTEGLYDAQWNKAIEETQQGNVNIITIISWNEFAERTQIEPTFDTTSNFKNDPFYIFNKTKIHIKSIKATAIAQNSEGV